MNYNESEIRKIMQHVVWDYEIDPYELYLIVLHNKKSDTHFTRKKIFIRMLERLTWYDLINVLGIDYIKKNLSEEIIKNIRFKNLKDRYEFIRKILQGETVSFTGWSDENRKRIKHSLLSNRWYSIT